MHQRASRLRLRVSGGAGAQAIAPARHRRALHHLKHAPKNEDEADAKKNRGSKWNDIKNAVKSKEFFTTTGKLLLCDLAGSERLKKSGSSGQNAKE